MVLCYAFLVSHIETSHGRGERQRVMWDHRSDSEGDGGEREEVPERVRKFTVVRGHTAPRISRMPLSAPAGEATDMNRETEIIRSAFQDAVINAIAATIPSTAGIGVNNYLPCSASRVAFRPDIIRVNRLNGACFHPPVCICIPVRDCPIISEWLS